MEPRDLDAPEKKRDPIVFEFVEPADGPEPDEVPETDLVSTKRSVARSEEAAEVPASVSDLPASAGESPLKENRAAAAATEEAPPVADARPTDETAPGFGAPLRPSLLDPSNIRREVTQSVEESRFRNPRGKSELPGELSFNTVDFEFAPYLMELKRKIEEKWYPPLASFGRGFKGESVVRFAVARDGRLDLLELVSGADHESLDTAALNAVRYGAPFAPLPEDFPEERWVITCTFYYR